MLTGSAVEELIAHVHVTCHAHERTLWKRGAVPSTQTYSLSSCRERAAVTCHTMTMFAFLWQPKCLDSIRTKNCIRLGFSHISLSIFARRSNNLGKNVPGEAPRDIDSRQHTRKTGDAVENSSQTTLSTLQRINNDEREPDAPSPFQLTKRAVVGRCNPREYSEEKRDNRIASERAAPIRD